VSQSFLQKLRTLRPEWTEPTACPGCGNYRLDFNGSFECPQPHFCRDKWDDKLMLSHAGRAVLLSNLSEEFIEKTLLSLAKNRSD